MGCGKQEDDGGDERGWSCNPAGVEAAGHTPSVAFGDTFPGGAGEGTASAVPHAIRPEMAPQAPEKTESAPDHIALPRALDAAPREAEDARSARANDILPPAAEPPQCDPAPAASGAGAQVAPQAVENVACGPGNDTAMAEASPSGEPPPHAGASAPGAALPEETRPPANSIESQPDDWPDITTVVRTPDPASPGGFRLMRIRILRNGVAACADAA